VRCRTAGFLPDCHRFYNVVGWFCNCNFYSGCEKNDPIFERFFIQPLIPPFRISECIFEKRYNRAIRPSVLSTADAAIFQTLFVFFFTCFRWFSIVWISPVLMDAFADAPLLFIRYFSFFHISVLPIVRWNVIKRRQNPSQKYSKSPLRCYEPGKKAHIRHVCVAFSPLRGLP